MTCQTSRMTVPTPSRLMATSLAISPIRTFPSLLFCKMIPDPPDGFDVPRLGRVFFDLLPKVPDVDIDRPVEDVDLADRINFFQEGLSRIDMAGVGHQGQEELELEMGQHDRRSVERDFMFFRFDLEPF